MSLVKKIAICTGFDENNNNAPIWEEQEIGVKPENITLNSSILGHSINSLSDIPDKLNTIFTKILPLDNTNTFDGFDQANAYEHILALDNEGKISAIELSSAELMTMYNWWLTQQSAEPN